MNDHRSGAPPLLEGVAIVGMAGRFPGADNVAAFWRNQLKGIECISHFKTDELEWPLAAAMENSRAYVKSRSIIQDAALFDADFFGIYPREAELMDPQHRIFLECCWTALEDAAYDPFTYDGSIGVYAGCSMGTYFLSNACTDPSFVQNFTGSYQVGHYLEMMGNSRDFLTTRVSYKLNLRGPSVTLQSGCSTSLVAVTFGCQALLTYQTDMVLAGGCSISFPQKRAAVYQEGGMISPDGQCRTFDATAQGTVFGSGVAVVVLKRLQDALRDGDQIYSVIRGFAINNDGSAKVGYTAPSVEGQANVIALALETANVEPETIGYVEAHGTATPLGDPIELSALSKAYRAQTNRKQFCTIGSAKPNVGHLDICAGVTGLIHASHIVRHGIFPPTLHFREPNPAFDLAESPFVVRTSATEWASASIPRRAGVSAFGVGGTNAHIILEQAPEPYSSRSARGQQLLLLSARSEAALDQATAQLAAHLRDSPNIDLANTAWTLQVGRRHFAWRRALVASSVNDAIDTLTSRDPKRVKSRSKRVENSSTIFLFPGQGSQRPNMGREIHDIEAVFRGAVDECAQILQAQFDIDLRALLYPAGTADGDATVCGISETIMAQPAIFTVEYALARLLMDWGIRPQGMLGHSVGEFVAACLAGVFSLEDAIKLVALRGRLMQEIAPGAMLSLRLSEREVHSRLTNRALSIAAVNSPSLCAVSGPLQEIAQLERELRSEGIGCRRLLTSHAFHSSMMDPVVEPFRKLVSAIKLRKPEIPYISGVTGNWIRDSEATDPSYWAKHIRETVRFSRGISELQKNPGAVFVEVGPGSALSVLARQHAGPSDHVITPSLSERESNAGDYSSLLAAIGSLWMAGINPAWRKVHTNESRKRISLPTYPFERRQFWWPTNSPGIEKDIPEATDNEQSSKPPSNCIQSASKGQIAVNDVAGPSSKSTIPSSPRRDRIQTTLLEIFGELSGMDLSSSDPLITFVELGFDSLFLTQITQALQNRFGLKIAFRQLLGDQSSLRALADYLDGALPSDALPATTDDSSIATPPTTAAALIPAPAVMPEESDAVARLMRDQHQAMNELFARQLEMLRGSPANVPERIVPPPISAANTVHSKLGQSELRPHGPYRPVQRTSAVELTSQQANSLNELIASHTARTRKSKAFTQEHRKVLADPRAVSGFRIHWKEMVYPIVTDRSHGSHIWDIDGNDYIDLVNGFGPIMLGHRPPFVEKAIEDQLHRGIETGPQSLLAGEVAKMFCDLTGNDRMSFCNTGSEAVIAALRVARTVTGRNKIAFFSGDYHGMFDEVLVKGLTNKDGEPRATPIAPGIPRDNVSNIVVLDYGHPDSLSWIQKNAAELAAVLVEPVQSRHPDLQPIDFLRELREITLAAGTALIFDEVVTGFRVHPGGCQALFDIRADLATYGKVVAGGMPIGILAGKSQFMDALDGGFWQFGDLSFPEIGVTFFAGTFVRHPLTLAACKAVLQHFKTEGPALQAGLSDRTAQLVGALTQTLAQHRIPTKIERFGSIFYFGFAPEERFTSLFYYYLLEKGIYVREGFPCFLTTAHTDADIQRIIEGFDHSARAIQRGDFVRDAPEPVVAVSRTSETQPPVAEDAPITESQLEVWLADQLGADTSCSFNESVSLHLRGPLNEPALKSALGRLIGRHDALRARFNGEGDGQTFVTATELDLPLTDLTALPDAKRAARLAEIIKADATTPFLLGTGPLVRAQLLRIEPRHHILIFTAHHIVCDGWSTNILLAELADAYNALSQGRDWTPSPAMTFAAYAKAQATYWNSDDAKRVEEYWLKQFNSLPSLVNLPTDRPRPAVRTYAGATYRTTISRDLYTEIKKLGAKQKCTLFVTLLAAFQILLSRLSNEQQIVVGIPTAGQSLLDDSILVGHCVNFIPMRGVVSAETTAADFLKQTKQTVLAGYEHQSYTYGRLVRKLELRRDPSRLPLTEIQFNLERIGDRLSFDNLEADVDPNPKSYVNFDVFLNIMESANGLVLDCDYSTSLFDAETIVRWMEHYKTLLKGMAEDASIPATALPLLTPPEANELIYRWNDVRIERTPDLTLHGLIERQVEKTPSATALIFGERRLTFLELDRKANQFANYLRKLGVNPGMLVGIFVERSVEMIVALLGTLKAGAAYIPLDPTYPAERIRFVIEDAGLQLLVSQSDLAKEASFGGIRLAYIDRDISEIVAQAVSKPHDPIGSHDLAYVIYTSGSTGQPKGVEVPHGAVSNLLQSVAVSPGISPRDVLAAVTTLSFDISALELFAPLCVGATLALATREIAQYGVTLLEFIKTVRATIMQATPVTWQQLLEAGWNGDPPLKVLCGGEAFPPELARELCNRSASVWNMYGPTETTIWSAAAKVEHGDGIVPIGLPLPNTQFYVLDERCQLVPIGVYGELYIGGEGVTRGYRNRPELTAERFLPNFFQQGSSDRMYKTGDLVRRRPDGMLEFSGRLDDQIKLRGFRIELGEIEAVLASYPGIAQAAVAVRQGVAADKRLVGYFTCQVETKPTNSEIREFLLKRLPDYMVPGTFIALNAMPLTPSGKVDRNALPDPDWTIQARTSDYVAPSSLQEITMAKVWSEVLRVPKIGVHDNIFELGADSLHVFQITSRAVKAGLAVAPKTILEHRTIAAILKAMEDGHAEAPVIPIGRAARQKYKIAEIIT